MPTSESIADSQFGGDIHQHLELPRDKELSMMSSPLHRVVVTTTRTARRTRSEHVQSWTCLTCRTKQNGIARRLLSSASRRQDEKLTPAASSTALPSHTAKQRSAFTKRLSDVTDSILARASIAGQHINTYTGTDYSGIEALRQDIREQETEVRTKHGAVAEAKTQHTEARAKQASSQKEIVGLLERKSSWSPADLERYMSLVRSEHVDDQAVQKAADTLAIAERELEGTRSLLEKLERKQYHEEQIWSDTIRRNSTWVTIGLMGVNIVLLLAQISIFEPYRRKKIVRQIEQALDERTAAASLKDDIVRQVDLAVDPEGMTLEEIEVRDTIEEASTPVPVEPLAVSSSRQSFDERVQHARATIEELFSDAAVTVKRVDLTTLALQSLAAGTALGGAIAMMVFRSAH